MKCPVIVNQAQAKLLQPTTSPEYASANFRISRKIDHRLELPAKTLDGHLVAVHQKLTVRGMHCDSFAVLYIESELLTIHPFEDAERCSGIDLRKQPHGPCDNGQGDWNGNAVPSLRAVVMRMPKCKCRGQILPACKVQLFLRFNSCHQRGSLVIGNSRVYLPPRVADSEQPVPIQRDPAACISFPILGQPFKL